MTCIVGLLDKGKVYIGGDTLGSTTEEKRHRKDDKVFKLDEFIIGFTTSYRMGQVLRYAFKPPPIPKNKDDLYKYMVTEFVDALRALFKEKGFGNAQGEMGEAGGTFLVGIRKRLFRIDSDYQVAESRDKYDAVGCGSRWAQGSLFSTKGMKPEKRILLALKAAEHNSTGVEGPFTLKWV